MLSGYSKGYSYRPEQTITLDDKTNHAWNVVKINNEWRFVECTWGAGHLADGGRFKRAYNEFYFLTDPDKFIVEHFPYMNEDLRYSEPWQLLSKPWNIDTYSRRLKPHSHALDWGVEAVSHKDGVIHVDKEVTILLREILTGSSLAGVMAHLIENGRNFHKASTVYRVDKHTWKVHVRPPKTGTYKLEIYGRQSGDNKHGDRETYDQLMDYGLICDAIDSSAHPFPENNGQLYGPIEDYGEYGFASKIEKITSLTSRNGELSVTLDTTRKLDAMVKLVHAEATIANIDNYAMTQSTSKTLTIQLRLPRVGYYKMTIFGKKKDSGGSAYSLVHTVLVHCEKTSKSCAQFPHQYGEAQKYNCRLIKPTTGELPAETTVHFRFSSPDLERAMVNDQPLKKIDKTIFEGRIATPKARETCVVFGSADASGSYYGLYTFTVV
jgi:hypothetical protein